METTELICTMWMSSCTKLFCLNQEKENYLSNVTKIILAVAFLSKSKLRFILQVSKWSQTRFCRMKRKIRKWTYRGVGLSHGLWPWKYLREGGAINQWKICKWQLKTTTILPANIGPSNKYIFRVGVSDILILLTV
jgi:hypothetical protein